jgi:hypothetical protein
VTVRRFLVLLLTIGLVASALAAVRPAQAHNSHGWYWARAEAEDTIYDEGFPWLPRTEFVEVVRCKGFGPSIRGQTGVKLFKHFRCYINTENEWIQYGLVFHVLGKYRWMATRLS